MSAPTGPDGVTSPMREVDFDTFFTSSKLITLDSVYFQAGSRVQCAARAVNSNGDEGLELSSPIVSISTDKGEVSLLILTLAENEVLYTFQNSFGKLNVFLIYIYLYIAWLQECVSLVLQVQWGLNLSLPSCDTVEQRIQTTPISSN